jgi:hypothetical protein
MRKLIFGLLGAAALFASQAARADIPPPDACQTENAACHNAGTSYDKDGVCTKTTCSRGGPSGQITSYDCFLCQLGSAAGAAGAVGTAGAPSDAAPQKNDGGCSVGALGALASERGIAALMLGLGMAALGISRRRR